MNATLQHTLETDGIVVLHDLIPADVLRSMQESFAARLEWPRFSDIDGYERTERMRLMVQDVLTIDRGFVELALHPRVLALARAYLGPAFRLCEAKGWQTLETERDFHGWHADAWYDQSEGGPIHRELKLAFYLSRVESGEFNYVRGSHRREHPRSYRESEVDATRVTRVTGEAGTGFLFDTSGIHRQGVPVREARNAVFLAYHDAGVKLQAEDTAYHRYHPLLLNAAFLGDLDEEDRRILGFGDTRNHTHAFRRRVRYPRLVRSIEKIWKFRLWFDEATEPVRRRIPFLRS
ncbi:MAG: hypothetical protein HKP27_07290 [Myxococcales bacterium]|nr:hypothetical protein [Myxococcales bacterium]